MNIMQIENTTIEKNIIILYINLFIYQNDTTD